MPARGLPVRPDLDQLKHQAKDLLRAVRRGDPSALADFATYHPRYAPARTPDLSDQAHPSAPDARLPEATVAGPRLADAHLVLARGYAVRTSR